MITGELKNKVDKLWEMFWTGGLTNPLDVIEQITYLMFIRDLDQTDNTRQKESGMLGIPYTSIFAGKEHLKWSVLRDKPAETLYQIMQGEVFPFIKGLNDDKGSTYAKYMDDAIFKIPTPQLLEKIVTAVQEYNNACNKKTAIAFGKGDFWAARAEWEKAHDALKEIFESDYNICRIIHTELDKLGGCVPGWKCEKPQDKDIKIEVSPKKPAQLSKKDRKEEMARIMAASKELIEKAKNDREI